jgi:hypothetical protein
MATVSCELLSSQIRALETAQRSAHGCSIVSSGCPQLDACLPAGGYELGSVVEWLESAPGSGGYYLALAAARQAVVDGLYWVVIDRKRQFYPPAAEAMGLPLERLVVIHPANQADEWWAMDVALRCSAIGAVIADVEDISELQARRFQLAAEQGHTLGLWLRPAKVRNQPSWAEVQWWIEPPRGAAFLGSIRELPRQAYSLSRPFQDLAHPCHPFASKLSPKSGREAFHHRQPTDHNLRRIDFQALRLRGRQRGERWSLTIDLQDGRLILGEPYVVSSSLCLASELAMPARADRARREPDGSGVRGASA